MVQTKRVKRKFEGKKTPKLYQQNFFFTFIKMGLSDSQDIKGKIKEDKESAEKDSVIAFHYSSL